MLAESTVMAMVAVSDLAASKAFYGDKLGLKQTTESPGGVTYQCGIGRLFVYPSPSSAGHNEATSATWDVADIEAVVRELKAKGITFEHFELPDATYEGDIASFGPVKAAWFKDPDGNVLGLSSVSS